MHHKLRENKTVKWCWKFDTRFPELMKLSSGDLQTVFPLKMTLQFIRLSIYIQIRLFYCKLTSDCLIVYAFSWHRTPIRPISVTKETLINRWKAESCPADIQHFLCYHDSRSCHDSKTLVGREKEWNIYFIYYPIVVNEASPWYLGQVRYRAAKITSFIFYSSDVSKYIFQSEN